MRQGAHVGASAWHPSTYELVALWHGGGLVHCIVHTGLARILKEREAVAARGAAATAHKAKRDNAPSGARRSKRMASYYV